MSTISDNAKAIFLEAVEKHLPAEWPDFLDQRCVDDGDLRGIVEGLLWAHAEKDSLFDRVEATRDYQPLVQPGQTIGPYKIREQIGDGGMGVVYVAEQVKPLRRKVALKVIKPGMDSEAVLARFEAERNALALMDHPNIARVLDAGTTEQGRPYFVMELIQGQPITDYCDGRKLTINERLELFTTVCQAVQHAHQKGVIHRDIKPNNVLVTEIDGKAITKVIDFGIAKALSTSLTDRTIYTSFQALVGTPLYMSPEQAKLSGVDIDTRCEVYSLGVLLYELLTGEVPFDRKRLKEAALDELCRIVREEEPPKPSTRLSTLGQSVTKVSANRKTNTGLLGKAIRGDLDLIVMKAMEKDRGRRYETANGLAADVRRFLTGDAIEARAPSSWYRLRRAAARNKAFFGTVGVVILSLSIGLLIAVSFWNSARRALEGQRETLREQVLLTIMSGEDATQQLQNAEHMGVDSVWISKMRGLTYLLQGQPEQALVELEPFQEQIDDSLSGYALVGNAYAQLGNEDELFNRLAKLRESLEQNPPDSLEDQVLNGWAISRWLPKLATQYLGDACESHQTELVPRILRGNARCWLAASMLDREHAIQLAHDNVSELEAVYRILPDNAQVQATYAHSRMVLAHLHELHGDPVAAEHEHESIRPVIDQINQGTNHAEAVSMRIMYILMRNENQIALNDFEEGRNVGKPVDDYLAAMFLPAVCFLEREFDRGLHIFEYAHKELREEAGGIRYFLRMAEARSESERSDIAKRLQQDLAGRLQTSQSKVILGHDWAALMMLGERKQAQKLAEILYESSRKRKLWDEEVACMNFMRRQPNSLSADQLLDACRDSQIFTCYAHFVIACDLLSLGEREIAKTHFAAASQTGDFQVSYFWWSKAFQSRAMDRTWLPWLNQSASTPLETKEQSLTND